MRRGLILLLLVPLVAAEASPLSASQIHAENAQAQGPFLALVEQSGATPVDPAIHFTTTEVQIQIERGNPDVSTLVNYQPNPTNTSSNYQDAAFEGTSAGSDAQWALFALQDGTEAHAQLDCMTVTPKASVTIARDSHVPTRHDFDHIIRQTSNALQTTSCGNNVLHLQGDFVLMLWDWNATLTTATSSKTIATGHQSETPASVIGQDTQLVAFLHHATVTVPLSGSFALYFENRLALQASSLTMEQATGNLFGQTFQQATLRITGALDVAVQSSQGTLAVTPTGIQSANLNGELLQARPRQSSGFAWDLLVVPAFVAIAAWQAPNLLSFAARRFGVHVGNTPPQSYRERRAQGFWLIGRWLQHQGRNRLATRLAHRAMHAAPNVPDHPILAAVAFMELQDNQAAYAALRRADELLEAPQRAALTEVELASVCLRLNRTEEAAAWLQTALATDPEVVRDELTRPEFQGLFKRGGSNDPSFA